MFLTNNETPVAKSIRETNQHKEMVKGFMTPVIDELRLRAVHHDDSKLVSPELEIFVEYGPKLKTSTYGSDEYKGFLKEMSVALDHHYGENRHHPEFFTNGIKGMTLIDLLEMISDWMAAVLRHDNGDIYKSLELNQERFGYSDELKQILKNTVAYIMYLKGDENNGK